MRLLVFQHIACEHPGIFRSFLAEDGIAWDAVELDAGQAIPDLEAYDALWVMGGPMDVWDVDDNPWLESEKAAIREWVQVRRKPFLGVCLGHQLLADALGGRCDWLNPPEVGILEVALTEAGKADPVFAELDPVAKCLQWHSVQVVEPPEGSVTLASSEACRHQALRVGQFAYSIQYHVELEAHTIADWGDIAAYATALEKVQGVGALARMDAAARPLMPAFARNARRLYDGFVRMALEAAA
ncbi:MAG: type 1 glutamine amidotransferase [Kiloniellales bacterium]|nr:type 1 glutamine amidotransferase [Kiloniellales bacterium]